MERNTLALNERRAAGLFQVLAVMLVSFHLYTAATGALLPLRQRTMHVGLVLAIAYLTVSPGRKPRHGPVPLYDILLGTLAVVSAGYVFANTDYFNRNPAAIDTVDLVLGAILVLLILEAGRRTVGVTFIVLTALVMAYALYSHLFEGVWASQPLSFDTMLARLYRTNVGIWGSITGVSATDVAVLLIFADILLASGGADLLRDASVKLTGGRVGGTAKAANVSSMLMGTISGSSAANAAMTGSFTIPSMKAAGYKPRFAAAVEATSSSFGQLIPPVMGAAAFLIAESLGTSYIEVATSAILPAAVVYVSIFAAIHFYSRKHKVHAEYVADEHKLREGLRWYRVLPIAVPFLVLVVMMAQGRSVQLSAFRATITTAILYVALARYRTEAENVRDSVRDLYHGVLAAARSIVMVGALIVTAQILVSMANATAIGVKLSQVLFQASSSNLLLALFLTAGICLILGMGLPTTAAYIVAAAVTSNFLIALGVDPLAAHLFILYFAVISSITPPVCVSVYITAGMAGSPWFPTALEAIRLSAVKYVVPFLFVLEPALVMRGDVTGILIFGAAVTAGGIVLETVLIGGWRWPLRWWERVGFSASALALLSLQREISAAGAVLLAVLLIAHYRAPDAGQTTTDTGAMPQPAEHLRA